MQPARDQVLDAVDVFLVPGRRERARADQVPAPTFGQVALGHDVDVAGVVRMTG
jgi:hypothetical protein